MDDRRSEENVVTEPTMTGGFGELIGMEVEHADADRVVVTVTVGPEHLQPFGIVHGGVHCAAVESAASIAASIWYGEAGTVVGVNNSTNFIRAVRAGARVRYTATPIQRGRTQQLWQVEGRTADGTLVVHGQVRLANLPQERTG